MPDLDLAILEILIVFFLFMPVIRPYVKSLWQIEGFLWFPPAAFLCLAGLFAVYGLRPECLPLALYSVIANIVQMPALLSFLSGLRNTDFSERRFVPFCLGLSFLALSCGIALAFVPVSETALVTEGVETSALQDGGRSFTIRVYGSSVRRGESGALAGTDAVILAAPPAAGSFGVIDHVCAALAARGAVVVTYSRKDSDLPAYRPDGGIYPPSLSSLLRSRNVISGGRRWEKENALAREAEAGRARDIACMMAYIERRWPARPTLILGYGVAGGAAVYLSADETFTQAYPALRGIIAVESYLYAAFNVPPPPSGEKEEPFLPFHALSRVEDWLARTRKRRLNGIGDVPRPLLPVVFLISAAPSAGDSLKNPYAALLKTARQSPALVTVGPLPEGTLFDRTDVPQKYPVLRFIASGFAAAPVDLPSPAAPIETAAEALLTSQVME